MANISQQLNGRTFETTDISGISLADGPPITLSFTESQLHAYAGCNRIFGEIAWAGSTLTTANLAATMMACSEPVNSREQFLLQILASAPRFIIDGEQLTLRGEIGDRVVTIELVERPAPPLVGTRWELVGLIENSGVRGIPGDTPAAIEITDSRIAVNYGCNSGGGAVTVAGDSLTFGPMGMTRKMCQPEAMAVERHVSRVLQGTVEFIIDGEELTIGGGELGLRFRSQDA